NNIATDQSYLLVGDNGSVPKWLVTGAPAGQHNILSRIWKVQERGTIGSVKLSFFAPRSGFNTVLPQGNETGKLYLTISPDAVFNDNNNTVLPLTFDGKYWTANADLTSGQFFTIYKEVDYPGGIVTAPMVWYRADVPGPTPTTKWYDQGVSDGDVTATAAFTDPKTSTRLANYNPSYTFDGVKFFTSAVSDLSFLIADQDLFGVSMQTSTGTTGLKLFFGLGTNATSYARNAIGFSNNRPAFLNTGTNGVDYIGMSTNTTGLNWQLLQGSRTASTVTQSSWGEAGFQTSSVASGVTIGTLDHISVGTHRYAGSQNSIFDGWVPEVMAFGQTLTTDQRNRVRTYLGLKYGITLDHNYFDGTGTGTGTLIWDRVANNGFNKNIFGIGRDDIQRLHQRQSRSINPQQLLIIGNNNTIGTLNDASTGNDISTNKSYLILGDDGADLSLNYTPVQGKYYFNRKWKLQETGTIGSVKIRVPAFGNTSSTNTLPNFSGSALINNSDVYLAVDNDGNFSNGGTTFTKMTAVGTGTTAAYEVNIDLTSASPFLMLAVDQLTTDTDSDDIKDVDDIDDDNDGVLDITEYGTCANNFDFSSTRLGTASNTYTINGTSVTQVSTQTWNNGSDVNGNVALGGTHAITLSFNKPTQLRFLHANNTSASFINTNKWTITSGGSIFRFTDQKTELNVSSNTLGATSFTTKSATNNDAESWVMITSPVTSIRILADYPSTATVSDLRIQMICDVDTDADGQVNRLDLDSDGDTCPDAREAAASSSATAATFKFTGNVGTNGLVNTLETTADNGVLNYNSVYSTFALNNILIRCLDNDNDGITDAVDLDDDNDGVLDIDEQVSCTYPAHSINTLTYTGNGTVTSPDATTINSSHGSVWVSKYSTQNFKLPIHLEWTTNTSGIGMFGLLPVPNTQTVSNWNDGGYKVYHDASTIYGYFPKAWNFTKTYVANTKMEIDISTSGLVTVKQNGILIRKFQGVIADYKLTVSSYSSKTYSNVKLTSYSISGTCVELDTDGDGIVNRYDLDSDDDGCNDAVEAGAASVTAQVPFTGSVGANGVPDLLETSSESGLVSYENTYDAFALTKTKIVCEDTDSDGVFNHLDIDDDNDGVLDIEEQKTCVYQDEILDDLAFTGNTIVSAYDNLIVVNAPGSSWTSSYSNTLFKLPLHLEFTTDVSGSAMIGLLPVSGTQTVSNWTDGSYKFYVSGSSYYGKMPSTSWNFSGTYTANTRFEIDITEQGILTAKIGGNVLHRVQVPVEKYRLVLSSPSTTEKTFSNVKFSEWGTDAVCTDMDTDKDGIVNRLDIDSDGDGCNDGVEAGAVLKTVTVPITTPVGTNG
ncbi:MAG: hypothetical protein ACK5AO_02080, partial [bacterium]